MEKIGVKPMQEAALGAHGRARRTRTGNRRVKQSLAPDFLRILYAPPVSPCTRANMASSRTEPVRSPVHCLIFGRLAAYLCFALANT